jgi:HlyD family secretion protein
MSRVSEKSKTREQPTVRWGVVFALPLIITAGVLAIARVQMLRTLNVAPTNTKVAKSVNALGRLEPKGEVIRLSAPTSGISAASRVEQILVREGERVRKDQIIAVLDSLASNQAAVEEAKAKLQESRASFTNVKVVSPRDVQAQKAVLARLQAQLRGETEAQQATITRIEAQLRGEKIAQQATVNRLTAELQGQQNASRATVSRQSAQARNAQVENDRYERLYEEGAISREDRDRRRLSSETADQQLIEGQANRTQIVATLQQQIAEARANQIKTIATLQQQIIEARVNRDKTIETLRRQIDEERAKFNRIEEVRPTDVQMAQAKVSNAIALVRKAEAEMRLSYITAPIAGEIIKIHTKAGENMSPNGIAEIGRTDQMIAIAEVPEDSIGKVRLGQKATISSDNGAFSGELQGSVVEIGRKIGKKDVLNTDPAADVDARVVEVKIALPPQYSQKVAGLTYAKVAVEIDL